MLQVSTNMPNVLDNPELWNAVVWRATLRVTAALFLPCGRPEFIAGRHARRDDPAPNK